MRKKRKGAGWGKEQVGVKAHAWRRRQRRVLCGRQRCLYGAEGKGTKARRGEGAGKVLLQSGRLDGKENICGGFALPARQFPAEGMVAL